MVFPTDMAHYGISLLGIPTIGSESFILDQLTIKKQEIIDSANQLIAFPHSQSRFLLLTYCFSPKITYIIRNINPDLLHDFLNTFKHYQELILKSCFG